MVVKPGSTNPKKMLVFESKLGMLSLNKINVNGAYIQNATIETAKITDAAITTLKLDGQAVTIPSGKTGATGSLKSSQVIGSMTVSGLANEQKTLIILSASVTRYGKAECAVSAKVNGTSTTGLWLDFRHDDRANGEQSTGSVMLQWLGTSLNIEVGYFHLYGSASGDYSTVVWTVSAIHCKR
jgi:hypothetical protein